MMRETFEGESQNARPRHLEGLVDEVATNEIVTPVDNRVPDSVKRKVNRDLWDRLSKEEHPPDKAD